MIFHQLFELESSTYTYLLACEETKEAILIDTVYETVERDFKLINELGLKLKYVLETHVHADHITGAAMLREKTGAKTAVSIHSKVSCADMLIKDGEKINFGKYSLLCMETPGHTDSCMSYYIDGMIFTGDVLFIRGCGRTDFQQGSPEKMYASIKEKIYKLSNDTKIYPGHDYKGMSYSTVGDEKKFNPRIFENQNLEAFSNIMNNLNLPMPKKIKESVPANLLCGQKS